MKQCQRCFRENEDSSPFCSVCYTSFASEWSTPETSPLERLIKISSVTVRVILWLILVALCLRLTIFIPIYEIMAAVAATVAYLLLSWILGPASRDNKFGSMV